MIKRWMVCVLVGMLLLQVTGCGKKTTEAAEGIEESVAEESSADTAEKLDMEESPVIEETKGSVAEPVDPAVYQPAEISCVIPKEFIENEEEAGLYLHKSYPKDISSISYVISESEEDVTQLTSEEYKTMLEDDFYNVYGDVVSVVITQYNKTKIDGRPSLEIKLEYEFKGVMYEQLIYMIYNGTESHILSYTQEKDGKWMEKFEESAASITLVAVE